MEKILLNTFSRPETSLEEDEGGEKGGGATRSHEERCPATGSLAPLGALPSALLGRIGGFMSPQAPRGPKTAPGRLQVATEPPEEAPERLNTFNHRRIINVRFALSLSLTLSLSILTESRFAGIQGED